MPAPEAALRAARSPAWTAELKLPAAELRRLQHASAATGSRGKSSFPLYFFLLSFLYFVPAFTRIASAISSLLVALPLLFL